MKASLQLKYSQQLTMTPQLQQAIKLLQLSTLELQQEIQAMLETNPLLEVEGDSENFQESFTELSEEPYDNDDNNSQMEQAVESSLYELSPVDVQEDVNQDPSQLHEEQRDSLVFEFTSNKYEGEHDDFLNQQTQVSSPSELLLPQLNLCSMSDRDLEIAYFIIDALDERGYLRIPVKDITLALNEGDAKRFELDPIEEDEVLAVLHQIQNFEPSGVAALNLQDCLLIQLRQLPENTPWVSEAINLVERYINQLATKDFIQLRRKTRYDEDTLTAVIKLIQSLNPNPLSELIQNKTDYIIPDLILRKHHGKWLIELNENTLPKIRINELYASSIKSTRKPEDKQYLKNNLQEARWFIKSLHSRHETLLKVAQEILKVQENFFDDGEEAMKPLVLHDIAERVGMHESTISRVTTQKYLLCPKGIFELKYFFSSHVTSDTGDECSSIAIRAHIKKLIANENRKKPLSDSKIALQLAEQGISVARRTIAKYRESLSIPPSNERKQLL